MTAMQAAVRIKSADFQYNQGMYLLDITAWECHF